MIEKRLKEINDRKLEIRSLLEGDEEISLEEVKTELETLEKEQGELTEKRNISENIATIEVRKIEQPKETKQMEFNHETVTSTPEFRSAYLKNLQGRELNEVEKRALTTASNSAGAAVPTQTLNSIIDKLRQSSALFPFVNVSYIPGNVSLVVANAKNAAAWKTEGADGTPADDTVTKVNLAGYELIKLVEISAAASAMTIDAFEAYIVDEIGRQLGIALENAILNGTGDGQPTGIDSISWVDGTNAVEYAALDYDALVDTIATLPTLYHPNAKFVLNRKTFFSGVQKIKDGETPVFNLNPAAAASFTILGYPVVLDDYVADGEILFGDFSKYYVNFAQAPAIETSIEAGFRSGKKVYRGLAVVDGKPALAEAFVKAYPAV
jgi:HK97 family phage major capsid protein